MSRSIALLDRRMVAAIQLVGPLGEAVDEPVALECSAGQWFGKGGGLFVLQHWADDPELSAKWDSQQSAFAVGGKRLEFTLRPAGRRYMARKASLRLPRDPDPANRAAANSLFQPAQVALPAATAFALGGNAAGVIVGLSRDGDDVPIENAVVRLRDSASGTIRAVGITNAHGEALLVMAGLALAAAGSGASASPVHGKIVEALVDQAAARFNETPPAGAADPVDPDRIVAAVASNTIVQAAVDIRAGHVAKATLLWSAP